MAHTVSGLWSRVVDWENFMLAAQRAATGKRRSQAVSRFFSDLDGNIAEMIADVESGGLEVGAYERFLVYDPKRREIHAPSFRDRVLHHGILNVCESVFEGRMIFDSYACRRGKGQHAAVSRAVRFARRQRFFLKMDIRRFFDSVDHTEVGAQLASVFREEQLLSLFARILDSYHSAQPGKGLPIGALTSQYLANSYLNELDRFIKEELRVSCYVRYMDDFVVWGESSAGLRELKQRVEAFLHQRLALRFKPEPYIQRTELGMDFLGYRVFPGWIKLSRKSRRRFDRKMKALLVGDQAPCSEPVLQRRVEALTQFTMFARSWHFRRKVLEQCAGQVPRSQHGPETGHAGR